MFAERGFWAGEQQEEGAALPCSNPGGIRGSAAEMPQQVAQRSCMKQPGKPYGRFLKVIRV